MPASEELDELCRSLGLTLPLATLYLLAFVRQTRAEVELRPEHSVGRRDGGPFRGDRVTWDLMREIAYSDSLRDNLATLRQKPVVTCTSVLPYSAVVAEDLRPANRRNEVVEQERLLLAALRELGGRVQRSRMAIEALSGGSGEDATVALDQIEALSASRAIETSTPPPSATSWGPPRLTSASSSTTGWTSLPNSRPASPVPGSTWTRWRSAPTARISRWK